MKVLILLAVLAAASAIPVLKSPQDACSECVEIVNTVDMLLKQEAFQDEVISLLEEACTMFGSEAAECKSLVQTYGKQLIQLILNEIDNGTQVCTELHLCSATKKDIMAAVFKKAIVSRQVIKLVITHHAKISGKSPQDECSDCKEVVNTIYEYISNPEIESVLIALIEKVCTYFGAEASLCKSLIETYGKEILQYIVSEFSNATKLCTELHLCSASRQQVMAVLLQKATPIHPLKFAPKRHSLKAVYPIKASAKCVLCEFVASKLDGLLTKNATEQEIIAGVEKVCSFLPKTVRTECDGFIEEYGPAIIQILSQELNPQLICATIGLCANKQHRIAMMRPHKLKVGSNETCSICTTVMTYVKDFLENNATEDEIISALEKVCNYLPSQIASECNAIVSEYGREVLKIIAQTDSHTLCQGIGLCSSAMRSKPGVQNHKCYLGASYWCASPANAKACEAVHFCKRRGKH